MFHRRTQLAAIMLAGSLFTSLIPAAGANAAPNDPPLYPTGAIPTGTRIADHKPARPLYPLPEVHLDFLELPQIPVANQGALGSCTSWAISYAAVGLLEKQQNLKGSPHAAMYTYTQLAKAGADGKPGGTNPVDTLTILANQGVDTREHFAWRRQDVDHDWQTPISDGERASAARWKISGFNFLSAPGKGADSDKINETRSWIKDSLLQGMPVALTIKTYPSFHALSGEAAQNYTYMPKPNEKVGYHEMVIVGFSPSGVRLQNSWGTNWGDGGYANVPWEYIMDESVEFQAVGAIDSKQTKN